eukprot:COSAG02_NODE_862_length_16418_cov_5.730621_12_plen_166_part_00
MSCVQQPRVAEQQRASPHRHIHTGRRKHLIRNWSRSGASRLRVREVVIFLDYVPHSPVPPMAARNPDQVHGDQPTTRARNELSETHTRRQPLCFVVSTKYTIPNIMIGIGSQLIGSSQYCQSLCLKKPVEGDHAPAVRADRVPNAVSRDPTYQYSGGPPAGLLST